MVFVFNRHETPDGQASGNNVQLKFSDKKTSVIGSGGGTEGISEKLFLQINTSRLRLLKTMLIVC